MSLKLSSRFCLSLFVGLFCAGLGTGFAQGFQLPEPENLQILPKNISSRELRETMRNFSQSLGVQCEFCHVGRAGDPSSFDYAADKKGHKKKARLMMKMTTAINETYLPELGGEPEKRMHVTCMTCHRKLAEPVTLQDALAKKINEEGNRLRSQPLRASQEAILRWLLLRLQPRDACKPGGASGTRGKKPRKHSRSWTWKARNIRIPILPT